MIVNAGNKKISASNLPNMSNTLIDWFQPITFGVISRELVDYEQQVEINYIKTQGVVQPYKAEPLEIQKAGVRAWEWQMIHCLPNLTLNTDDVILYQGIKYKVLFKNDYSEYGYVEYLVCETFTGEEDGVA